MILYVYIISVSNSAYTSAQLIIPPSFINTGQSFKRHPNIHAKSRHIAFRSMGFQRRQILVDLELKQQQQKYRCNMNERKNKRSYTLHKEYWLQ